MIEYRDNKVCRKRHSPFYYGRFYAIISSYYALFALHNSFVSLYLCKSSLINFAIEKNEHPNIMLFLISRFSSAYA